MNALKLSSFAAAFLAGTALATLPALSQDTSTQTKQLPKPGSESAPSKNPSGADASQSQGSNQMKSEGSSVTGQPEGQSSQDKTSGKRVQPGRNGDADDGASGQMKNSGEAKPETGTTSGQAGRDGQSQGQTAGDEASGKKMKSGKEGSGDDAAPDQMQNSGTTDSGTEAAPGQAEQQDNQPATIEKSSRGTKGSVNITEKQTTEIRTVIKEDNVEPVDVDFDVNVGVSVPDTIELHQLPPRIVKVVPEYEGYVFFVSASGQIIIVEPDTHEIVYIIVA